MLAGGEQQVIRKPPIFASTVGNAGFHRGSCVQRLFHQPLLNRADKAKAESDSAASARAGN